MAVGEWAAECDADVLVSYGESLQVYAGLLTVATVCGGLCGVLAASLLYVFCVKPLLLTKQGYSARRLLEPEDGQMEHNPSDCDRKEAASLTTNHKEKQQPMNSDVTAFASRAKVVYPINQKYRPLADGASNPSLHEQSKVPPAADEESSSSSSDGESLSREQDNSSQFLSSSLVPKSLQNQSFTRVSHYPQMLTQTCFEGRISLYCLALHNIQHLSSQLEEDKYDIFLQLLKKLFSSRFSGGHNDADFTTNILQMREKELNDLRKRFPASQTLSKESCDVPCSLEGIERAQKDLLERCLETSTEFSRQVESLCQLLLKDSSFHSPEEAQSTAVSIVHTLLLVENSHMKTQEADLKRIQERVLWWEEVGSLAQSQPALLRWEATLTHGLIAGLLEQLTSDGVLDFSLMETILSEINAALTECLRRCTDECKQKTEDLMNEKCCKKESRMKKLQRSHTKEKSRVLEAEQAPSDLQDLTVLYLDMLTRHRQQVWDLELQQDHRVTEALFDLWKRLRTCWSKRLTEAAKVVFLSSLPAQTSLTAERCEKMWLDVGQELVAQLQQAEGATTRQLQDIQAELKHDGQVWDEGVAMVRGCLKHLGEHQRKILHSMVVRESYTLSSVMGSLIERTHERLLVVVQRYFLVRHVCLHMLKEMRLSKLKTLSQTDFRALLVEEPSKGGPMAPLPHKSSAASLADRHLGPESQLLENSHQQEFLSELETAAEILQSHAQLVLGNALSYTIHQSVEATGRPSQTAPKPDDSLKLHLIEASAQSVYLTKDSLTSLVQRYYSRLKDISRKMQPNPFNPNQERRGRQEGSSQLRRVLLRELEIWGKKPASTEFQQRVELNKRKVLEQSDSDQEILFEAIRQKKVAQEARMEKIKTQLMEAEESFMAELAAVARVSVHAPDVELSGEEDGAGDPCPPPVLDLLALNPALDPALNPSLTPTFTAPAIKAKPRKKREREARVS